MLTFTGFTGINNILPEHRLRANDLIRAENVDIGLSREVSRREGFTEVSPECHKNVWDGGAFTLATCGSALTALWPAGPVVIDPVLGSGRVWYCNLPDGRTTYSNGYIHGITDGHTRWDRSVPAPAGTGVATAGLGGLIAGKYRVYLSHVRPGDNAEGPVTVGPECDVPAQGGIVLTGLPVLLGHALNVYLTSVDGEGAYFAGSTLDASFVFSGRNSELVLPCRVLGAQSFPTGTVTAFWRGRVITAVGNELWASRPSNPLLSDWRDFKLMEAPITAIIPVADGLFVGTEEDLFFLDGSSWDALSMVRTKFGPVVLGSGVSAPGHLLALDEDGSTGQGAAGVCIAGGEIIAVLTGGKVASLSAKRYRTDVREVWATFRDRPNGPQYMAVPYE